MCYLGPHVCSRCTDRQGDMTQKTMRFSRAFRFAVKGVFLQLHWLTTCNFTVFFYTMLYVYNIHNDKILTCQEGIIYIYQNIAIALRCDYQWILLFTLSRFSTENIHAFSSSMLFSSLASISMPTKDTFLFPGEGCMVLSSALHRGHRWLFNQGPFLGHQEPQLCTRASVTH